MIHLCKQFPQEDLNDLYPASFNPILKVSGFATQNILDQGPQMEHRSIAYLKWICLAIVFSFNHLNNVNIQNS